MAMIITKRAQSSVGLVELLAYGDPDGTKEPPQVQR